MSKPTASVAVAELLNRKFIMETGKYSESVGRKGEKLSLNTNINTAWLMGILVGVKETKVIAGNLKGAILEQASTFKTPTNYETFLSQLFASCDDVLRNFGILPLGCAISMPGMGNDHSGEILLCPNIRFLDGKNVVHEIKTHFGINTIQIQEVRAIALGALQYENSAKYRNIFCLSIGDGIGGAVVLNGVLYQGTHHTSGEIGHIPIKGYHRPCGCGRTGCLETILGVPGLLQTWKEKFNSGAEQQNFYDVCKKYPEQAKAVLFASLPELANSLQAVIQLFDPEVIFVYGPVWNLIPESVEELKKNMPDRIEVLSLGTTFAQGAFASVFNRIVIPSLAELP
jgi:predicted NBD/HSP70 family sugar kinase